MKDGDNRSGERKGEFCSKFCVDVVSRVMAKNNGDGPFRKHRQKRENYVIALEEEIRHLRRELHTSQLHNRVLSDALSSHGVSIQGSSAPLQSNSNMARVALVGPPGPNSFLQLQKTDSTAFSSPGSGAIGGLNSNVTMQSPDRTMITDVDTSPQYARGDYTSPKAAVSSAEDKTAGDSAVDDSGLEFVLTYTMSIAFDDSTLTKPLQIGTSMSPPHRPPFYFRWNARTCPHP